jgi:hypothetical protein
VASIIKYALRNISLSNSKSIKKNVERFISSFPKMAKKSDISLKNQEKKLMKKFGL